MYTNVVNGEFDDDITDFLAEEASKADARKKVNSEKRREKKRKEREAKRAQQKEAERRTLEAAKNLIDKNVYEVLSAANDNEVELPRYMQV